MSSQRDTGPTRRFTLEHRRVRRSFDFAAGSYDDAAVLQHQVRGRMLERLDLVRLQPRRILDAGAGTGAACRELSRRYRGSEVLALDVAEKMLLKARQRQPLLRRWRLVCADVAAIPIAAASVDLIFSNLVLQWCNDLDAVLAEFRRILRPGGLLTFTTLGPDTLQELRAAWRAADDFNHVNAFLDMHDVGDAVMRAGLADPVMDVEHFELLYSQVGDLMADLKAIGARNATGGRPRGLTGKGRLTAMRQGYERFRREGRLPATYEVVYGHAWAADPRRREPADEVGIPVSAIRRRGARP